jgi:hypothetical protein
MPDPPADRSEGGLVEEGRKGGGEKGEERGRRSSSREQVCMGSGIGVDRAAR